MINLIRAFYVVLIMLATVGSVGIATIAWVAVVWFAAIVIILGFGVAMYSKEEVTVESLKYNDYSYDDIVWSIIFRVLTITGLAYSGWFITLIVYCIADSLILNVALKEAFKENGKVH